MQAFLGNNNENSNKPDHDPRGALRNPNESVAAGIVGPMGSRSFSLPNIERSLTEMEGGVGGAGGGTAALGMSVSGDAARKLGGRATGRPLSTLTVPSAGGAGRSSAPLPTRFVCNAPWMEGGGGIYCMQ